MSEDLELYTSSLSPFGQRIELQLKMKGLPFTRTVPEREYVRQGEFGVINPIRKIPVLVINGIPVPEAQVISELVEDMYPDPPLRPKEAIERSRVHLLSRIADLYVATPSVLLMNNLWGTRSKDIDVQARVAIERGLSGLEHWIAPGPFAFGNSSTTADCAIVPALFCLKSALPGFGVEALPEWGPNTTSYFQSIQNDDAVANCLRDMKQSLQQRLQKAHA